MHHLRLLFAGLAAVVALTGCAGGDREAATTTTTGTTEGRWVITDLGTLGSKWSWAVAINGRGQVIGGSDTRSGRTHAFLWRSGTMRDLGTLGGKESEAVAINDRGQIIGSSQIKDMDGDPISHAFLWEKGTMRDLGTLGGKESEAVAINDRGQIIGSSQIKAKDMDGDPISHAFLWGKGKMRDLGTLRGNESAVVAINDRGQVAGYSWSEECPDHSMDKSGAFDREYDRVWHAWVWSERTMTSLPTLGSDEARSPGVGDLGTGAENAGAMNDHGQIVGSSTIGPYEAAGTSATGSQGTLFFGRSRTARSLRLSTSAPVIATCSARAFRNVSRAGMFACASVRECPPS